MNKNKFIEYIEAVKFGPAMSERNFFHHGAPGIDDEAPKYNPKEIRTEDGILVYTIDSNELTIYGYRYTPWIGNKQIRLIPEEKRTAVESELRKKLSLNDEINFSFR